MKIIKTKRKNGTTRVQYETIGPSMTDQSDKNYLDINNIMKNYAKTGLLPQFKEKIAQYIDTTQIPSYMEAQEQMSKAKQLFMQLPSEVRKLMDNNPANMEKVIVNPDYKDILIKYGIYEEKATVVERSDEQAKPAAQAKSDEL